jgi:hypothetical protein
MVTNSVTSSTNAPPLRPQLQADQAKPDEQARKAEQARQEEKAKQTKQAKQPEQSNKAPPVVNTQGQTTGKVVNITA